MRICAGITLFNPEIERLSDNVSAILPQVEKLYLVDNASANTRDYKLSLVGNGKVEIIENEENLGIATALNQMCQKALKDNFDFIITLDQDSVLEGDIVEKFIPFTDMEDVALITPKFDDENEPDFITSESAEDFEFVTRCNTSGSFVRLTAYNEVGGFDDKMFIDCVDFDFCTTLIEHGFRILRNNNAVIHHRLGEAKEVKFFIPIGRLLGNKKLQKSFFTYNHSPLRTYYYARNIHYYMYKHKDNIDLKIEKRVYFKWVVLKLFFEKEKFKKLKAIIKGKKDAKIMIKQYLM